LKLLKICILLGFVLVVSVYISSNPEHGEKKTATKDNGKTTLFNRGQGIKKTFPSSKIKNDAAIMLFMHFPEDYHLIKDAGSSYTLALGDNVLINGTILSDETPIKIPKLPDTSCTLVLNLNYYYCTKKGVCLSQTSNWQIPVNLSQDGLRKISLTEIPYEVEKERSTPSLSF